MREWCPRNDIPLEYGGEDQAICTVGLVKPRPGIFVAAIQHLLVLCTTTEVGILNRQNIENSTSARSLSRVCVRWGYGSSRSGAGEWGRGGGDPDTHIHLNT